MNFEKETMRVLKDSISHYEKMSMLARSSGERAEYRDKANRCRDELNYLLDEYRDDLPWTDPVDWDVLEIDDDVEWSFLQIMYRLKAHKIDCLQVINWFDGDDILITGIREMYPDRIAKALGVHKECISLDSDVGVCIVNLFKEKCLRKLDEKVVE